MVTANKHEPALQREFDRLYSSLSKAENQIETIKAQISKIQNLVDNLEKQYENVTITN